MVGSRYDKTVAKAWRQIKKPFKFTVDVQEYDQPTHETHKYFVQLVVYSDEIQEFSEIQRMQIMEYLYMCKNVIESYGIVCILGGVDGSPPSLSKG